LPIEIRPFNETTNESTDTDKTEPDARTREFMETLRARINFEDEARQEKWDKAATKATGRRKPPQVARPDWLNPKKTPKEEAKAAAKTTHQHPLAAVHKRKGS
jgi:hypothetical protein